MSWQGVIYVSKVRTNSTLLHNSSEDQLIRDVMNLNPKCVQKLLYLSISVRKVSHHYLTVSDGTKKMTALQLSIPLTGNDGAF